MRNNEDIIKNVAEVNIQPILELKYMMLNKETTKVNVDIYEI